MPLTPIEIRKYVALVTQISTDDPTAIVLHNTLGGTVTWTRTNVGEYQCSGTGLFGLEKTTIITGVKGISRVISAPQTDDYCYFETLNQSNFNADNILDNCPIEISVYYTETTPNYS